MLSLLESCSLWPVVLTLGVYLLALKIRSRWNYAILNPILVSFFIILGLILAFDLPNAQYQAGWEKCSWLLNPSTVCLALPLYRQLKVLKKDLPSIFLGIAAGTVTSLVSVFFLCQVTGLDQPLTTSLLPKSITTAMGIVLAENMGGYPAVTTIAILATGIGANIAGDFLCRIFRIRSQVAQGVAYGTAAHVVGTAKATEVSPLTGAVSSLSLVVAGILTAVILPLFYSV